MKALELASEQAFRDGIDAGNESQLVTWIRHNCKYDIEHEYYMVLIIGSRLANMQSQDKGYKHAVDEAYQLAQVVLTEKAYFNQPDTGRRDVK